MYETFFNFKVKPFDLVPNPDFLFLSRSHKKAKVYLDYGIRERAGFILITGEVGSGKTTLVRDLIKGLNGSATLSKVFNTKVTSEQLIAMINEDFGLDVENKDKITLLRELNDFLIDQYANHRQPILIVDEAQNLSAELLEEVRMLSNLETDRSKLLQIILVGQPELTRTLAGAELRQLRQRINIRCHISPLTRKEMEEYILHRLKVAGNREAISFSEETFNIVHGFSRGIPRLVNIICDFLLLSAFVEGTRELSPELVKEVIGELEMENKYWQDELLERRDFGDENAMKCVNDLITRIGKLEEEFNASQVSRGDKEELLDRLSLAERSLFEAGASAKAEISAVRSRVNDVMNELGKVRSLIDESKKRSIDESEKRSQVKARPKKRNFWKRMFS
jgi:general secretion pathway protein A